MVAPRCRTRPPAGFTRAHIGNWLASSVVRFAEPTLPGASCAPVTAAPAILPVVTAAVSIWFVPTAPLAILGPVTAASARFAVFQPSTFVG